MTVTHIHPHAHTHCLPITFAHFSDKISSGDKVDCDIFYLSVFFMHANPRPFRPLPYRGQNPYYLIALCSHVTSSPILAPPRTHIAPSPQVIYNLSPTNGDKNDDHPALNKLLTHTQTHTGAHIYTACLLVPFHIMVFPCKQRRYVTCPL